MLRHLRHRLLPLYSSLRAEVLGCSSNEAHLTSSISHHVKQERPPDNCSHAFSSLQWDQDRVSPNSSSTAPSSRSQRPAADEEPTTSQPHFSRRPQVGGFRDRQQHLRQRAGAELAEDVLHATSGAEAPEAAERSSSPPSEKPQLTADGKLHPRASVRFVAQDGSHRIMTYAEAATEASRAGTQLKVVSLDAKPPVVKLESTILSARKPQTMKQQKATIKEKRKRDLEQRRANTFKEIRVGFRNADNDLQRQLKGAQDLLEQGYRVKLTYTFQLKDMAPAKQKFLDFKQDVDSWGFFEQSEGDGIHQKKMGGGQAAFLILLLPKRVKQQL